MTAQPLDREALRVACSKVIARYSETPSALAGDGPNEYRDDDAVAVARAALDLEARVAELERENRQAVGFLGSAQLMAAAAEANVREAREVLAQAGRSGYCPVNGKVVCPVCGRHPDEFHDEECPIGAILARPASDDALRAVCEKVADNPWTTFGRLVWHWLSDRWDSSEDSYEVAELSVTAGLAERVPYDPEKHGEMDAEPGEDVIFFPTHGDPKPSDLVSRALGDATKGATEGGEA